MDINTTGDREHIPGVEVQIQVIKEHMRAIHVSLYMTE